MGYIITQSGRQIDVLAPTPDDICLEDIAAGLARELRYDANTINDYTVAQHSVLVASILEVEGWTSNTVRGGLLHDATEAYLGDIVQPLKQALPGYKEIEATWEKVILEHFGMTGYPHDIIKGADQCALFYEIGKLARFPDAYGLTTSDEMSSLRCEKCAMVFEYPHTWSRKRSVKEFIQVANNLGLN